MTVIKSAINPRAAEFQANAAAMSKTVADLRDKAAQVSLGGGESARAKHSASAGRPCWRALPPSWLIR